MAGPLTSLPEVIDLTDQPDNEHDEEPSGAENPHEGDFYMTPRFR